MWLMSRKAEVATLRVWGGRGGRASCQGGVMGRSRFNAVHREVGITNM